MTPRPLISIVTTCKGRLDDLRETLPSFVAQPDCEVVVVDYDCPQRCGEWVEANFPQVRVVRVADHPYFSIAQARNLGAAQARGDWLAFFDADACLASDCVASLKPLLAPGSYLRPALERVDLAGQVVVARDDFTRIGGYDEVIEGWGNDDDDFYFRLGRDAVALIWFSADVIHMRDHDDALRTRFHPIANKWLNVAIGSIYLHVKYDLARMLGADPPLARRQEIYREVRASCQRAIANGERILHFDVHMPLRADLPMPAPWTFGRRVHYALALDAAEPANRDKHTAISLRPHLDDGGLMLFQAHLATAKTYLEFGAGGSTIAAASAGVSYIHVVDSDREWLGTVQRALGAARAGQYIALQHIDIGPAGAWGQPTGSAHSPNWHRYAVAGWEALRAEQRSPDLVLIDGRFRVACLLASLLHARPGTVLLFDDYANRPHYHVVERHLRPTRLAGRMAEFVVRPLKDPLAVVSDLLAAATDPA